MPALPVVLTAGRDALIYLITSTGGVLTGRGAGIIVIDDPLKPEEAQSKTQRQGCNEWFVHTRTAGLTTSARRAKPRRSRANLRPPSRSASPIDRLLKNQNPLEKPNNLRPSWPHLVVANVREPRRNFAVRNSWTQAP